MDILTGKVVGGRGGGGGGKRVALEQIWFVLLKIVSKLEPFLMQPLRAKFRKKKASGPNRSKTM